MHNPPPPLILYRAVSPTCPVHSLEAGVPVVLSLATAGLPFPQRHCEIAEEKSGRQLVRDDGRMAELSRRGTLQAVSCDRIVEYIVPDG